MPTGDQWKMHRRLTGDLLAPDFLQNTLSMGVQEGTQDLIRLWKKAPARWARSILRQDERQRRRA